MASETKSSIGILIVTFIAILFGVIGIAVIADVINQDTALTSYTENIDIGPARLADGAINDTYKFYPTYWLEAASGWRTEYSECSATKSTTNASGTALVETTDVVYNTAGYITFTNNVKINGSASNTTIFTMASCPDEYVPTGFGKTILNLITGFFALAILIVAAFMIFYILRREGVNIEF